MKNFNSQLAGQIGEHLVAAELGRRGIIATTFAGNVPDIDMLAYANGRAVGIQVKALRSGKVSVDAAHYLDLVFEGNRQIVQGKASHIDRDLIFIFVAIGERIGEDRFYVFRQGFLQDLIHDGHTEWLARHNGVRPRNPKSTHMGYREEALTGARDAWDVIETAFGF